jgi:hypothetical protein
MRKIKNLKEYSSEDSLFPRFRRPAPSDRQIKAGTPKNSTRLPVLLPFRSKFLLGMLATDATSKN